MGPQKLQRLLLLLLLFAVHASALIGPIVEKNIKKQNNHQLSVNEAKLDDDRDREKEQDRRKIERKR